MAITEGNYRMTDTSYGPAECAGYDFGNREAPEGFDPDAKGWQDPPPGIHKMTLKDFNVIVNKEFKWKGETYILNQIRPSFEIEEGEHAGAKIMDFLPMPTKDRKWVAGLANQWANLIKSLGFDVPKDAVVPPGFELAHMLGRSAMVTCIAQTDRDGQPKTKDDGTPRMGIKFFGYKREGDPITSAPAPEKAQKFDL